MSFAQIVDIGHTAVMLPVAGALLAWMLAGRAWRMALYWCILFGTGLGIVATSKIAYLGWQAGLPALEFQALSGHALRATVVLPVCAYVLLQGAPDRVRGAGVALGLAAALGVAVLLVWFGYHTVSEVLGSSVLGVALSLGFIRIAGSLPEPRLSWWVAPLSLLVFIGIAGLKPSAFNSRLVDVALFLSGREQPYSWSGSWEGMRCAPAQVMGGQAGAEPGTAHRTRRSQPVHLRQAQ